MDQGPVMPIKFKCQIITANAAACKYFFCARPLRLRRTRVIRQRFFNKASPSLLLADGGDTAAADARMDAIGADVPGIIPAARALRAGRPLHLEGKRLIEALL